MQIAPARGIGMNYPRQREPAAVSSNRETLMNVLQSGRMGRWGSPFRDWRRQMCLAIAWSAVFSTTACHQNVDLTQGLRVEHEIAPQPARIGPVTVTLRLTDASARLVGGAHIIVEADMTHAGMSPVSAEAKEIQPGSYRAQVAFSMAGDWVILLRGTLASGEKIERQFDVRGVRPDVAGN
jgi:YtkA-like